MRFPLLLTIAASVGLTAIPLRSQVPPRGPAADTSRLVWQIPSTWPNVNFRGSLSRDGRYLAYWDFDNNDIHLRDLRRHIDRRLTHMALRSGPNEYAQQFGDRAYAFSRDSKFLAYSWRSGQAEDLRVLDLQDSRPSTSRVLVREQRSIAAWDWLPDGKWIAVTLAPARSPETQLGLVSTEDGRLRILKTAPDGDAFTALAVSDDGAFLAFSRREPGSASRDVFVLATDTGREVVSMKEPSNDRVLGWSADGGTLAFISNRGGQDGVWTVPFANGQLGPARLIRSEIGRVEPMGLASSGAFYYRVQPRPLWRSKIASIDFSTGRILSAPIDIPPMSPEGALYPVAWSPDGGSLLYDVYTTEGPFRTAIRDSATAAVRDVGTTTIRIRPRWSPDGGSIATTGSTDRQSCCSIQILNPKTGTTRPVSDRADLLLAWSSDGRALYFTRVVDDGSLDTAVIEHDIESRAEREVHRWSGGEAVRLGIALSPDARTIYYRSPPFASATAHRLIAKDVASGAERELFRSSPLGSITVSPDGRYVVTASDGEPILVPTAGGRPKALPLLSGRAPDILAWAPDGRSFLGQLNETGLVGSGPVSYWWVPIDLPGRQPRRLDWSIGPDAASFAVGPDAVAFIEPIGPASPARELRVLEELVPRVTRR